MTIHPDDSREAFGVLALHFGGVTADTREAVELYRRLEAAWDRAVITLASSAARRERIEFEASLDEQYERERARDKRQRVNDEAAEWEAIEARDRFSREGDVETPLGEQIEGE